MSWPRITVVTPTFNRAEYLEETILSVLDQDYPNLEYIIVDGGSTNDRVFEIIRKYEDRLAWWISEPDGGHAEAIRKGFDKATGEILAWLCSDDLYVIGALRAVGECFRNHPGAEVVYGNTNVVDAHTHFVRELRAVPYSRLAMFTHINLHQPSTFWTRALYEQVGGNVGGINFEYNIYEPNTDLFYRFANANAKFVFLRHPLSNARMHPEQVSFKENNKAIEYAHRACRRELRFWSKPGIFQVLKLVMRMRQIYYHLRQREISYMTAGLWNRIKR
jgi:glycosyltransferase involved in cell wall biosynthesis